MLLITAVHDLEIDTDGLQEPLPIVQGIYLSWTPSFAATLVSEGMQVAMGGLEYLDLTDGSHPVLFSRVYDEGYHDRPLAALSAWHSDIHTLFHCLWLLKDNSLNTEVGFVESKDSTGAGIASSNSRAAVYTCADGRRRKVKYSQEEIAEALELYRIFDRLGNGAYGGNFPPTLRLKDQVEPVGTVVAAKAVRPLTRVWYFLSAARDCTDLSIKAAQYATCLEVLFSTDSTEIYHKLAERIALLLGESSEERRSLFHFVKTLYSVRSSLVHGDTLSREHLKNMISISQEADGLVRRVLRRIMGDPQLCKLFEGGKEARERYFVELVLR